MGVPVPCPHGGFVHVSFMLERADHLAKGYTDPKSCVVCSREGAGRRRPPHPAELSRSLPVNESKGRWAALRNIIQFADLLQRDVPGPGSATYLTTGVYSSFELMVRVHGRSPTSSFLLCSLFSDALGLPRAAYLDFPHPSEWEEAVGRYRALFTQDILLRLTNRRLDIGPHVEEYLVGLDAKWEELLTRWTLGVQNALEEGFTPSPFPVEAAPSPRGSEPVLERDHMRRGQLEQTTAAPDTTESHQNVGNRDTTSAEQPGTARARSEAASKTPRETVPSNRRGWGGWSQGVDEAERLDRGGRHEQPV